MTESYIASFQIFTNDGKNNDPIREIRNIHDRCADFDVDCTWNEALLKSWGVHLDPKDFCMRMRKKNGELSKQFSVDSKIVELLACFERDHKKFPVLVMRVPQPISPKKTDPLPQGRGGKRPAGRHFEEDNMSMPPPQMPKLRKVATARDQYQEDEDDAMSVFTTASQASQDSQADLEEMGIPYEDMKPVFLQKVKRLSNSQLLQARHALRQLKAKDIRPNGRQGKWSKWTFRCPTAVHIIRTLLDV